MEESRYGPDGSFQPGTLVDYLLPTACEVSNPMIVRLETSSPFTPLGAKGFGEGNNINTLPCITNVVADALGVRDIRLPLTPIKVMAMIGLENPSSSRLELAETATAAATGGKERSKGAEALSARGTVDLNAPSEAVLTILLDPQALAQVVSGCHALELIGDNRYRADMTVGVGMVGARYEAGIALSDPEPPYRLRLPGVGLSSLGSARGSGIVKLAPHEDGTCFMYDYGVEVSGRVAVVSGRMLEGAAEAMLRQLFESLGRQVDDKLVRKPGWIVQLPVLFGARR